MLKKLSYIALGLIIASCSSTPDRKSELTELKKQRDGLNKKIEILKTQLRKDKKGKNVIVTTVSVKQFNNVEFKHYVEVQGLVESDNNILIPIQSPGLVQKIYVSEGDRVVKGDVLAQVDSDLINRGIEELTISLELATTVFDRQERLWNQKIGSEVKYLQVKTQKESLEKKLESLKKQLEMTKIISPINGTVDEIIIREGEMAGAGKGAIRVVNVSDLKIKASLSESYVNDVKRGDNVRVNFPTLNSEIVQKISSVAKVINPSNLTFDIELVVPKTVKGIKPNMSTILNVNDYTNEESIVVPINILQNTGTDFFLFKAVQKDGKWYAKKVSVKTGKYYNNMMEILEGVKTGDYLITFGFQQVSDGSMLNIIKE